MENLPKNWVETDLMNLCEVYTGKKDANFATENGEYNFFTCAYKPLRSDSYSFEGNVLILPGNGVNVGEVFYFSGKFEAYQRTYIVNEIKIDPKYLFYHFRSFWREIGSLKQFGSATNYIKIGNFKDYKVQFPPLAEQQRIVAKLDGLFGHLDSLKQRLEHIPTLLKQFRQSVLTQAVTGKLTEEWREGKELGEWKYEKATECCEKVQSGGTPKGGNFSQSGIPFFKVYNIVNQKISFKYRPQYISKEIQNSQCKKSICYPNDVLMNIVGPPLNKVAIVPENFEECNINQAITLFRVKNHLKSKYLYYFLSEGSSVNSLVNETSGVVGQVNISLTQCREFQIPIPTIKEQTEIVHRVEALFAKADTIEAAYQNLKQQIDNLPQAILAKAFKGELVAQLPTDGDAKDLLKEIAALRASLQKEKKSKKKQKVNA
jgi:type I restriction enzyme S subunit